ncbi:MAG: hypothetical protein QMD71_05605 [bacterium]|nr:hypothetical protein [bacterium]
MGQDKKLFLTFLIFQIVVFFAFLGLYSKTNSWLIIFTTFFALLILGITLFSVEKVFFLILFYSLAFPAIRYIFIDFRWLHIGYTNLIGLPLFLLIMFYWIIWMLMNTHEIKFTSMDLAMIVFMLSFLFSSIIGIMNGNKIKYFAQDFIPIFYYLTYFIFLNSVIKEKNTRIFYEFLFGISIIIGLQFLYSGYLSRGLRVCAAHVQMAQLTIPYIGATLVYSDSTKRKAIAIIGLIIILPSVIISYQRALWITVGFSLILFFFLLLLKRKYLTFFTTLFTLFILIFGGLKIISKTLNINLTPLLHRTAVITNLSLITRDISWVTRNREIEVAFSRRTSIIDFIFGKGLGDYYVSRAMLGRQVSLENNSVDNCYAFLLWKLGYFGLISYLIVLFIFFNRCIFLFRTTKNPEEKIYSLSSLFLIGGMSVIGFTNDMLIHDRYVFLWATNFAMIECLTRKYMK